MSYHIPVTSDKHKNGIYRVRFVLNGRDRRISLQTRDKKIAEQRRFSWEQKVNGEGNTTPLKVLLFSDLIDEYVKEREPYIKPSHWRNIIYRSKYIKKALGNRLLNTLTSDDFKQFLLNLHTITGRELQPSTKNRWHDHLSAFCAFAQSKGYIPRNPLRDLKKFKENNTSEGIRHLSVDECLRLINSTPKTKPLWATYIYTGMRQGEMIALTWSEVDFENKLIKIRRSRASSTKSNKERIIGINPQLEPILRALKEESKSRYLFPAPNGEMRKSDFRASFKTALQNAQIKGKVTEHNLRHTCASLLSKAGVEVVEIQRILGHSDISITLRYIHYTVQDLQESINKIELW